MTEHSSNPPTINSHDPKDYQLEAIIHASQWITTHKAKYVKPSMAKNMLVTIKVFHNYKKVKDIYGLTRAIVLAKRCSYHANINKVYCSFKYNDQLWVVMPFAVGLSLRSMLQSSFPHGLSKTSMVFILQETLKGIDCVHGLGEVHEGIDSDNVCVEKSGDVKLGFGVLSYNEESNGRPDWMAAPELVIDPKRVHCKKADIWMFGLLAMELFYGKIPASDSEEFMSLVTSITDFFGTSTRKTPKDDGTSIKGKSKNNNSSNLIVKLVGACLPCSCAGNSSKMPMPSRLLGEVMALCLAQNPSKRPTASELLKHEFFNNKSG